MGRKLRAPGAACWPWPPAQLLNPSSPAPDHLCSRNWEAPSHLGLCLLSVKSMLLPAPSRAWPSSSCRFQLIPHLHRVTFLDSPSSCPPLSSTLHIFLLDFLYLSLSEIAISLGLIYLLPTSALLHQGGMSIWWINEESRCSVVKEGTRRATQSLETSHLDSCCFPKGTGTPPQRQTDRLERRCSSSKQLKRDSVPYRTFPGMEYICIFKINPAIIM